jgi:hypothetical protein
MKSTLASILGDEVQHARFGWDCLRDLAPSLDEDLKARLTDYLVVAFRHLREHELHHLPVAPTPPSSAAESVGVCDGQDARKLFFSTLDEVIIPGLESYGFGAQKAWEASHVPC